MIRALLLCTGLAACTNFPEVGRAEAELANPGPAPALLTAEEIAALGLGGPVAAPGLQSEAAALRDRAARLRRR